MFHEDSPELVHFETLDPVEVSGTDQTEWPFVFDRIRAGQLQEDIFPSYGAFVFRGGGIVAYEAIIKELHKLGSPLSHWTFERLNSPLHIDHGTARAVTAHFTDPGSVEMLMFFDPKHYGTETKPKILIDRYDTLDDKFALDRLFDDHVFSKAINLAPKYVLGLVSNEGDTVVMDHRLAHTARSIGTVARHSYTTFIS